jgi:hypothetical protein
MRRWCLLLGLAAAAGCGWLDRLTIVAFQLPRQTFSFGVTHPQWQAPPQAFAEKIDCTTAENCCMPVEGPPLSCAQYPLGCDHGACTLGFALEVVAPIDLSRDAPELAQVRGQVPAEVTLEAIEYTVASDLNIALPEVALYVAPRDVSSASHPKAYSLGVIPPTNAGLQTPGVLPLTPEAQQAFGAFARDLRTPFNLIAATKGKLVSGSAMPTGNVVFTLTGRATAKF